MGRKKIIIQIRSLELGISTVNFRETQFLTYLGQVMGGARGNVTDLALHNMLKLESSESRVAITVCALADWNFDPEKDTLAVILHISRKT